MNRTTTINISLFYKEMFIEHLYISKCNIGKINRQGIVWEFVSLFSC